MKTQTEEVQMFRRILVTLDGSSFAEAALPAAVELARQSGGKLRLLTVQDPGWAYINELGWTFVDESAGDAARKAATRYMEETRARLEAQGATVSIAVRNGFTADEILHEADEFDADVIVMATHGRRPLRRFWLGSVASECARRASRPTLLIHPGGTKAAASLEPSVQRVVVPLDGSVFSERAVPSGLELSILFGCPLVLMHVVYDLTVADAEFFPQTIAETERILDHERAGALAYLDKVASPIRAWGLEVTTCARTAGEAAPVIVAEAGSDMIVMATHARTGLGRVFMGSVTDAVVRSAVGSVLVIPPSSSPSRARPNSSISGSDERRAIEAVGG
jgi:nucleotide-binding universal stress UspA family protein